MNRISLEKYSWSFLLFFVAFLFIGVSSARATTYYVDATAGVDSNSGTSTAAAWKTTAKVVGASFAAGDNILFKRGESWAGYITVNASGASGTPITFGAYGTGALPLIDGTTYSNTFSVGNHSYITVDSLNLAATSSSNALFNVGVGDGIILSNSTLSGSGNNAIRTSNAELTVTNCNITATVTYAISSSGTNAKARVITNNNISSVYSSTLIDNGDIGNFSLTNNIITVASGTPGSVIKSNYGPGAGGSLNISGNTINLNTVINVSASTGVIMTTSGQHALTIDNNIINSTSTAQTGNIIYIKDQANALVSNNTITTMATSTLYSTVRIAASANINMGTVTVTGNTLYSHSLSNYVLYIGEDAAPAAGVANMIDGAVVTHNKIYGGKYYNRSATSTVHGFLYGYNKRAIIRYNYFNASVYVAVKGEDDWGYLGDIAYNIFDNNDQIESFMFKGQRNIYMHNNTFYINPAYSSLQGHIYLNINSVNYATGIRFKYNILVGGGKISMDTGSASGFVSDHNIYWTSPANNINFSIGTTTYNTLSSWQAAGYDANSTWVDPKLIDPVHANFGIQSDSPAINNGVDTGVNLDYAGNAVPQGSTPDQGAYEFLIPASPTALEQYKTNGTTVVSHGSSTNEVGVAMKFSMNASNASDILTPQVEVQETGTAFTNSPTATGTSLIYSGSPVLGVVNVSGLADSKSYHWQARVANPAGYSAWVPLNVLGNTDFSVVLPDTTPPNISLVAASLPTQSTTTITWTTNENSDSLVDYGPSAAYGSSTTLDTNLVTAHSVALSGLTSNTSYHFRVTSKDASNNIATSSDQLFTTAAPVITPDPVSPILSSAYIPAPLGIGLGSTDKTISLGKSGDLGQITAQGLNYLTYINTNASFNIVASATSLPENHHLTIDNLDLFSNIIKFTIYSQPKSLSLKLGDITQVDVDGDKINDLEIKFTNLLTNRAELTIKALAPTSSSSTLQPETQKTKPAPIIATKVPTFKRNLQLGLIGVDVKELQSYLNNKKFLVAKVGPGSIGQETNLFGPATRSALIKFQAANKITPALGYFGPATRKFIEKIN